MINFIVITVGLLLLFFGGEMLLRGSVEISKRLGVSIVLIGVIVVGFGTSTPELLVSIQASLMGEPDIVLGNIVGSNIANVLLVLGIASIISPVICIDKTIRRDAFVVMLASIILTGLSYFEYISRLSGVLMLISFILYIIYAYKIERRNRMAIVFGNFTKTVYDNEANEFDKKGELKVSIFITIIGVIMLFLGSNFLIKGTINLARQFKVSEAVISLSIVAIGTSLPDLAMSIVASMKKNSGVIIGDILGGNLFKILVILGIISIIKPIQINRGIADFDIPFTMGVSIISFLIIILFKKFDRTIGIVFLIAYIIYLTMIYL